MSDDDSVVHWYRNRERAERARVRNKFNAPKFQVARRVDDGKAVRVAFSSHVNLGEMISTRPFRFAVRF